MAFADKEIVEGIEEKIMTQQSRMARKNEARQQKLDKKRKKDEEQGSAQAKQRKVRIRLIPIWLRIILTIVLVGGSLLLGIIVGFGVVGDGDPADALKQETWYHIIDIIRGR